MLPDNTDNINQVPLLATNPAHFRFSGRPGNCKEFFQIFDLIKAIRFSISNFCKHLIISSNFLPAIFTVDYLRIVVSHATSVLILCDISTFHIYNRVQGLYFGRLLITCTYFLSSFLHTLPFWNGSIRAHLTGHDVEVFLPIFRISFNIHNFCSMLLWEFSLWMQLWLRLWVSEFPLYHKLHGRFCVNCWIPLVLKASSIEWLLCIIKFSCVPFKFYCIFVHMADIHSILFPQQ